MIKIFISGFPLDMPEIEIVQIVAPHGQVKTIKIVRDKVTRICKGYAFLEMASEEDAMNAIAELDGTFLGERQLSLRQAIEKPATAPKKFNSTPGYKKPYNDGNDNFKPKRPRRTA